jgi:N-acetylmuramoyl-L-alanine amidase
MILGSWMVRVLEWRARWFSDPVDRLQFLRRNVSVHPQSPGRSRRVGQYMPALAITTGLAVAAVGLFSTSTRHVKAAASLRGSARGKIPANLPSIDGLAAEPAGRVWLVKSTKQFDLYSNGLRIENQYSAETAQRRYLAFRRAGRQAGTGVWRVEPTGIVFHTTESHIAPFEEGQNQTLQRAGEGLLEYANRGRAYHFIIDRFGRVFRVVRESDYANNAGNSVWADDAWIYINLNQSFFGVAFEAQSSSSNSSLPVTDAQVHAGRILTEMLRARYGILAANCVTHAQVSVNPGNLRAGYHVDWAANLPFGQLGLADNYRQALPSLTLFGFEAGAELTEKGGPELDRAIGASEAQVENDAAAQGMPVQLYRKTLQRKYRDAMRALRGNAAHQEYN